MNRAVVLDERVMPPTRGAAYPVFVPRTDADGRDIAGIAPAVARGAGRHPYGLEFPQGRVSAKASCATTPAR